jgi:hypothetical protein
MSASGKQSASAATAVPNFEVKLFLDAAKVLDVEFKPTRDTRRTLDLPDSNRKIAMQFIDARPVQICEAGWGVRVRKFEDQEKYELSYKRRYPLGGGTLAEVLTAAARDGFGADDRKYAAQVEWGYGKQTLSFTRKKEFKARGGDGMNFPSADDVHRAAVEGLPGKLDRCKAPGWARGVLAGATLYGPVLGKRWTGKWQGPDLSFEVWLIKAESGQGYEPVVELSFKEKKEAKASGTRDKLTAFVRDQGWLLERDVLKTQMILDRY